MERTDLVTNHSRSGRSVGAGSVAALILAAGLAIGLGRPALAQDAPAQPESELQQQVAENAEMIAFGQFAEPISIAALIDFVAEQMNIIILQTDATALANATVEFSAPIDVPRSELLSLLETLLTPKGFALVRSPEGIYMVIPSGEAQMDFADDPLDPFSPTRIIRTPLISPSSLKPAIDSAVGGGAGAAGATGGARIVYLDQLGVIISTASPRTNKAITEVVNRIIDEIRNQELQRIELNHIAAAEAKARVLELTGQSQQAVPGGAAAAAAQSAAGGRTGGLGNLDERLLIDRPTNALIYRGSEEEADLVRRYVAMVDTPSRLVVRRYYAGPTAQEITQVGSRKGLGPIVQASATPTAGAAARPTEQGSFGSGFVLSSLDSESFTYYGTDAQHEQVQDLVDEFAAQAREETFVVEFYRLRNVSAEETAELLSSLMEIDTVQTRTADSPFLPPSIRSDGVTEQGIDRFGASPFDPSTGATVTGPGQPPQRGGADAGAAGTETESTLTPTEGVAVIADVPNNQLIIRAPRRQQREFSRIIDKLDQRRAQVYIEVQIVSVSASKDFEFSVDTALTSPDSDVPIFSNFGLVPYGSTLPIPSSLSGFTAAVIRNDYTPVVINALTTVGDGRLVSAPKMLVNDNEEAELESVREEPFASTSQVAGAPSITSTGGTLSAGTTLRVRPTISERGMLRLEYDINLSAFGERPSPDLPPTRLSDNFTSIVTVPADSTIVVGGLTFDSKDKSIERVPLLGQIPLIGLAFQSQSRMKSSRTVYVFITPRILRDESFADLRLLTRGTMEDVNVARDTPELLPAIMPVRASISSPSEGAL